jgi:hypothetical protein
MKGTRAALRTRIFAGLAIAAAASTLAGPAPAFARGRAAAARVAAPGGRHVIEIVGSAILLDGRRVPRPSAGAEVVVAPHWRSDGGAVAWIEREGTQVRLLVVPALAGPVQPLSWDLPAFAGGERIFWTGPSRISVGPALLKPRIVASWS